MKKSYLLFIALLRFVRGLALKSTESLKELSPPPGSTRIFKKLFLSCVMLLATSVIYSQEICGNGIDDDGDGYVDQFDVNCYPGVAPACFAPAPSDAFGISLQFESPVGLDPTLAPIVGDLDGDGVVDIIVPNGNSARGYRIYKGDGSNLASNNFDFDIPVRAAVTGGGTVSHPAIADVDRDGTAEVICVDASGFVYVFNHTGGNATTFQAKSNLASDSPWGSPRVSDINEDGQPEIIVGNDVFVFGAGYTTLTRVILGSNTLPYGRDGFVGADQSGADIVIVDIIPSNPGKEIVAGSVVYAVDLVAGTLTVIRNLSTITGGVVPNNSDGPTAVADLDLDGDLDIVYHDGTNLHIWDPRNSLSLLNKPSPTGSGWRGLPLIAYVYNDVTHNGMAQDYPEVLITVTSAMYAYNLHLPGNMAWTLATNDQSGETGITAFDFNGDAVQEIVYNDEQNIRIINGDLPSPVNLASFSSGTYTVMEHPVVADVDGDGQAEMLAITGVPGALGSQGKLNVYGPTLGNIWQPARKVWNQRGYRVVNVEDNLTIPAHETNSTNFMPAASTQYRVLNQYNAQFNPNNLLLEPGTVAATDAQLNSILLLNNNSGVFTLNISIVGGNDLPIGTAITLYNGNPTTTNAAVLTTIYTNAVIPTGTSASLTINSGQVSSYNIYCVVNDNGSAARPFNFATAFPTTGIAECNYANNMQHLLPPHIDSDGDGITDDLDLDLDNDGILNSEENNGLAALGDEDGDGTINCQDVVDNGTGDGSATNYVDADGNGIPDAYDFDNDGIINMIDLDSDNDGIYDRVESGETSGADADSDGRVDGAVGTDGVPDAVQPAPNGGTVNYTILNTDAADFPNYKDYDSDNDACSDANEYYNLATADGGDGGPYGTGLPAVGATGKVTAASYTGTYTPAITVATPFTGISPQPAPQAVISGANASFTTGVTGGSGTGIYQWQVSTNNGTSWTNVANGAPYSGATTATLTITGATLTMNGYLYRSIIRQSNLVCLSDTTTTAILHVAIDSDSDGINDVTDLDDDNDGVLDSQENGSNPDAMADQDSDGVLNYLDADLAGFVDANTDGINDHYDFDLDGHINELDLDSDNDGIYDRVESGQTTGPDATNDGRIDGLVGTDGVPDAVQSAPNGGAVNYTIRNTDATDTPNYLDADSDNDGCSDADEAYIGSVNNADTDNNGYYGTGNPVVDANGKVNGASYPGAINNAYFNTSVNGCIDTDNDGVPDVVDLDDDNDGITDVNENCANAEVGTTFTTGAGTGNVTGTLHNVSNTIIFNLQFTTLPDAAHGGAGNSSLFYAGGTQVAGTSTPGGYLNVLNITPTGGATFSNIVSSSITLDFIEAGTYSFSQPLTNIVATGGANVSLSSNGLVVTVAPTGPIFQNVGGFTADFLYPIGSPFNLVAQTSITDTYTYAFTANITDCINTDGTDNPDKTDFDSDNDGCKDVIEAGYTDPDDDGVLGTSPVTVDANGLVTGQGGYTGTNANVTTAVTPSLTVVTPPANQAVTVGANATYTVNATVTAPGTSSYQWQLSTNNGTTWTNIVNGAPYSGATTATLTVTGAAIGMNGYRYRVRLQQSNYLCDSIISASALLQVAIDSDSDGINDVTDLDDDNDGILDSEENGTSPDAMADQDSDGILNYLDTDLAGFVDANADGINDHYDYDLDGHINELDLDSDNDGIYDRVESGQTTGTDATNDGRTDGPVGTDGVPDAVQPAPNGGTVNYTIQNSDAFPPDFPDYKDFDSDNDNCKDVIEAGYTDPDNNGMLGTSPVTTDANGVVTGQGGYTGTNVNVTTAGNASMASLSPSNTTGLAGASTSFQVSASATPPAVVLYQWQLSTDGGTTWTNIVNNATYSGATTYQLTISGLTVSMDGYDYRVYMEQSNYACRNATSASANLTVVAYPVANDDNGGTIIEDGANGTVAILTNDTDPNGNPTAPTNGSGQFTVDLDLVTAGIQTTITDATGTWTYDPATGIVTYDPVANYNGTNAIFYTLCDPTGLCDQAIITFIVTPVNDPPVVDNETHTIPEDTQATGDLTNAGDSDPDGTALTANTTPVSGPTNGTIVINADGTYTYTPNVNFNGTDQVVVSICDAGIPLPALCANDTIFITVTPVNDPPVVDNETHTIPEDTQATGDLTNAGDSDPDGTALTANTTPVSGPTNGTIVINADGTYTYTPNVNFNGTDQVVVSICDAGLPLPALCVNDTIFITVTPVNDPPVVDNETHTIPEDTQATGDLTNAGDSDPEGTALTANTTPVSGPTNGTIVINPDGTYTYTPNANFNGTDQVVVSICDAGLPLPSLCTNDTIFITITPVNDPPVVDNETHNINENTSATGDLTNAGDFDPDGTALTANTTPVSGPTNGNIVINPDGTYTYTPNPNFNGTDQVVVSICDAGTPLPALCVNDTIFINIGPVNEPPVVDNETHTIPEDTQATGDLTDAGDSDPDGTALTANTTPVSGPTNGTIVINPDGTYTYTPNANFNGTDQVVVSICDAGLPLPAMCTNDTIFITVTPVNDPPVVDNETHTIPEDTQATGDLTDAGDSDPDGTALTANTTPVSGPTNGTIVINPDGTYTYTPNANFNGTDQVVVSICDAGLPLPALCVNDTIFITVTPVNDPPVVDNETHTIPEDTQATGDLTDAGDSDPDGNLVVNTTPLSGPDHGTIVINTDGTYTYTPGTNYNGSDTVIVQICDDGTPLPAICVNDTIFITITPVNDPPVVDNENHTIPEDTQASGDLTDTGDSDVDGNLVVNTTPLSGPAHGTVIVNPDGTYTYTPNGGYNGQDTIIVQICDDGTPLPALCVNDTIFITVTPVNDPPIVDNEHHTINEDTQATGDLTDAGDSDPDGTALTASTTPVSGPSNGTIVINTDGTYTYTPDANFNGADTVVVSICDSGIPLPAQCVNDTIFITVTPVNDPPVVDNEHHTIAENTTAIGDLTNAGDSDVDGNLVVNTTPVSGPNHGTIVINSDGTYTYTPDADYNGPDTVIVQICDDGTPLPALCVNDTIFITVTPVNEPPVVDNEHHTINEDTQATGDLTDAGDSDPDGTALTASTTPVSGPSNGTIVINPDGTYTYTPNPNFNGTDMVVVSICDAGIPLPAQCVNDTIFITVNPVNDAPVVDNEHHTIDENTTASGDLTDAGDSDVDGNLVVNTTPVDGPHNGTIVINPDGTYTYTPNNGFAGNDTVIVQICDDGTPLPALCVNDTIFITVNPKGKTPGIKVPQAFTPDGDGVNDAFVIAGAENYPNNKLIIYNRWGNVVYETDGYQNDWKGISTSKLDIIGGDDLPTATYYYIFDTRDESLDDKGVFKGYIYLKR